MTSADILENYLGVACSIIAAIWCLIAVVQKGFTPSQPDWIAEDPISDSFEPKESPKSQPKWPDFVGIALFVMVLSTVAASIITLMLAENTSH